MQNKANSRKGKMRVSPYNKKVYENLGVCGLGKSKAKQSQSFDFAQDRSSDYPCVFELAAYNLVLRDGNIRDFDGEYVKWQMHPKPMQ
jgi:hypothetical protein